MERSKIHHRVLVFDPLCPSFVYFALHPTIPKETQSNQVGLNLCNLFRTFQPWIRDIHIDYRVLQTIQMKLIHLCIWAEQAVLGSAKTALKFKYEI